MISLFRNHLGIHHTGISSGNNLNPFLWADVFWIPCYEVIGSVLQQYFGQNYNKFGHGKYLLCGNGCFEN